MVCCTVAHGATSSSCTTAAAYDTTTATATATTTTSTTSTTPTAGGAATSGSCGSRDSCGDWGNGDACCCGDAVVASALAGCEVPAASIGCPGLSHGFFVDVKVDVKGKWA